MPISLWLRSALMGLLLVSAVAATSNAQVVPAPGDTLQPPAGTPSLDEVLSRLSGDSVALAAAAGDTIPPDSLSGPPLDASADSVLQLLRQMDGFTVTEYRGDRAIYRANEGVLRLEGQANVTRGVEQLTADTIIYRELSEFVEAFGSPQVIGGDQDLRGDSLFYNLATRRATAFGAQTEITQDATWFVRGDVTLEGTNRLFGSHARFTSCDLTVPHYHFETDRVMVIRNQILVARPARLYFGDVPVMVLPFVVQNLQQGRRSGFTTPRFGIHDIVRTSSGYNRQISNLGFYWAVSDYMGAEFTTTWRSGAYTSLRSDLQYNWRRQFLNGNVAFERSWLNDGSRELALNARSSWQPDERTTMSLNGRYASSSAFVREASYDPREVTQDLNSGFSLNRRFDWGSGSLGAERRQSIASGDVSMTLPSFSLSLPSMSLFAPVPPEQQSWYSTATFTPGSISGSRSTSNPSAPTASSREQSLTRFRLGPSFSVGNFTVSTNADGSRTAIEAADAVQQGDSTISLRGFDRDVIGWSASASYRQTLIGSSSISPQVSLSQELQRDTLTTDELLAAPMRLTFGTSVSTDLYGFFPGVGPFTAIRHRLSPRITYGYSPEVRLSTLQERVFGVSRGRTQNRVSLQFNQTFEAKLREPRLPEEMVVPQDSMVGDSIPLMQMPSVPSDPEKVTLLSLTTSAFDYDFVQAREEGNGFLTDRVSNTIGSDYLRGLRIQMEHELFDRRNLDPNLDENRGRLGRFSPRLSSLSTQFELGPQTALIQWLSRIAFRRGSDGAVVDDRVLPGDVPADVDAGGDGSATGNLQGTGSGPWSIGLSYAYLRPTRNFIGPTEVDDQAIQTTDANMAFQLTPNWSVTWSTSYSITDGEFGSHSLNFRRDLHEWQANFSFYQTPNGNSAFEFYVELTHNRDIRFDYGERNLGIDRSR